MSHSDFYQDNGVHGEGFIRLPAVLKIIPVSKSTWWDGCKTGRFPKPYNLGGRVTAWRISEIMDCVQRFTKG